MYAKHFVVGKLNRLGLELEFFIHVANLAYHKEVDVLWAMEGRAWQRLEADYHGPAGRNREIWRAHARFDRPLETPLPRSIQFALRYRVLGAEYWDNNNSRNYSIEELRDFSAGVHSCSEHNIKAGSRGYALVVGSGEYEDRHWSQRRPRPRRSSQCAPAVGNLRHHIGRL